MAKLYSELTDKMIDFIREQKMFFVATAAENSRVNLSPKGLESLVVLDNKTVAYLDLTGTGNETAAHIANDGRLTMMFCSFSKKPHILRLYGTGRIIHRKDAQWNEYYSKFKPVSTGRQIIVLDIEATQTSCGMGVPVYKFKKQRDALVKWEKNVGEEGLEEFRWNQNQYSIDGLPTNLNSKKKVTRAA